MKKLLNEWKKFLLKEDQWWKEKDQNKPVIDDNVLYAIGKYITVLLRVPRLLQNFEKDFYELTKMRENPNYKPNFDPSCKTTKPKEKCSYAVDILASAEKEKINAPEDYRWAIQRGRADIPKTINYIKELAALKAKQKESDVYVDWGKGIT